MTKRLEKCGESGGGLKRTGLRSICCQNRELMGNGEGGESGENGESGERGGYEESKRSVRKGEDEDRAETEWRQLREQKE